MCYTATTVSGLLSYSNSRGAAAELCSMSDLKFTFASRVFFTVSERLGDSIIFQDNRGGHKATEQVAFTVFIWAKTAVDDQHFTWLLQNKSRTVRRSHYILRTTTPSPKMFRCCAEGEWEQETVIADNSFTQCSCNILYTIVCHQSVEPRPFRF